MKNCTAIVLSGGGSLGALQAGALQALIEMDIHPDILVGTSIGAVNAACLAIYGFNLEGIQRLKRTWLESTEANLLPWFDLRQNLADWRFYFRGGYGNRIRDFFISHGVQPDLNFGQLTDPRVMLVACDLNTGDRVIYGSSPDQLVLEGMLASAAVPPWVYPLRIRDYYLADGGFVSNLPVEAAMDHGATRVITLELSNMPSPGAPTRGVRPLLSRIFNTVEKRQSELELALARARGIPVFRIPLRVNEKYTFWDFRCSEELIEAGYKFAQEEISSAIGQSFFKNQKQKSVKFKLFKTIDKGQLQ